MILKNLLSASCLVLSAAIVLAFSGKVQHGAAIKGNVKDKTTGMSVSYAGIVLERAGKKVAVTLSDMNGNFEFSGMIPGRFEIIVAAAGYKYRKMKNVIIRKDSTTFINISLEPQNLNVQEVVVMEENAVQPYNCSSTDLDYSVPQKTSAKKYKTSALSYGCKSSDGKPGANKMIGGVTTCDVTTKTVKNDELIMADKGFIAGDVHEVNAGILTASELNDFGKWSLWKDVQENELSSYQDIWKIYANDRYTVQVVNDKKLPVIDAEVFLENMAGEVLSRAKTDNTGKAELWAGLFDDAKKKDVKIVVKSNGESFLIEDARTFSKGINILIIPVPCSIPEDVDVAFVVDATSSMDDEINFLKTDLDDIIGKVKNKLPGMHLNLGSVFYRCFGNSYVTRVSDFSDNLDVTTNFINMQSSGEGGDEAVEEALDVAVNKMSWSSQARSRIIFLILDEMPLTTAPVIEKVHNAVEDAMKKGIRIVPVVASAETMSHARSIELLMRSIALATNGSYVFLTDHSKVGNEHSKPVTDEYDVQLLNGLLCNIIYRFTYSPDCEKPVVTDSLKDTSFVYSNAVIAHVIIDSSRRSNPVVPPDHVTDYSNNISGDTLNMNLHPDSLKDTLFQTNINHTDTIVNILSRTGFKYYPNPTRGPLTLEVEGNIEEVFLADISGKLLEKYKVADQRKLEINIRNYPNGIYFLEFISDEKWQTGKVILIN